MAYIGEAGKLAPRIPWMCKGSPALYREWDGEENSKK